MKPDRIGESLSRRTRVHDARCGMIDRRARTTLRDGTLEETARLFRRNEEAHGVCAGRFASDGHVRGVASKLRDVALHPPKRREFVEQGVLAGMMRGGVGGQQRMIEEPEGAVWRRAGA